jgi:hypothetical protein
MNIGQFVARNHYFINQLSRKKIVIGLETLYDVLTSVEKID